MFVVIFFTNPALILYCSERETQTKKDQGASVPKPSTYIAGLRGQGDLDPSSNSRPHPSY